MKREENYKTISEMVDALPGGVAIFKLSEIIQCIYFNEGFARLSGRSAVELKLMIDEGHDLCEFVYQEDRNEFIREIKTQAAAGESANITFRYYKKDGGIDWLNLSAMKIKEDEGIPVYYAIFTKPSNTSKIYQNLIEESSAAVAVLECSTQKLLYVNRVARKLYGIPDKVLSLEGYENKDKDHCRYLTMEQVNELSDESTTEYHKRAKDGKYYLIRASKTMWNGINAYTLFFTDETIEKKKTEHIIEILDKIPGGVGIFRVNENEINLIYINKGYYRLLGANPDMRQQYLGCSFIDVICPDDLYKLGQIRNEIINDAEQIDSDFRIIGGQGKYIWLHMTGNLVIDEAGSRYYYCCFNDIMEIKAKERMLLLRDEISKMLIDDSNFGFFDINYDENKTTVSYSNKSGEHKRYDIDASENTYLLDSVHPDYLDEVKAVLKKASQESCSGVLEYKARMDTKEYIWFRITYKSIADDKGHVYRLIGKTENIQAEKDMKHRYEQESMRRTSLEKDYLSTTVYNLTKDELVSYDSKLKIDDDPILNAPDTKNILKMYSEGESKFNREVKCICCGETRWIKITSNVAVHPQTRDVLLFSYSYDINDEKTKDAAMNNVIANDYEYLMVINVNNKHCKTLSARPDTDEMGSVDSGDYDKMINEYLTSHADKMDALRFIRSISMASIKNELKHRGEFDLYITIKDDNKQTRYKRLRFSWIDRQAGLICHTRTDVTDIRREELEKNERLSHALYEAQEANKAKSEFLSRMSHDMRTPMNAIIGLTQLARDEVSSQDAMIDYLGKMDSTSHFLLGLVNDVLDMAKIEEGKMKLNLEPYTLDEFKNSLNTIIRPLMEKKNIDFSITLGCGVKCILTDKLRYNQIFFNLLSNSAKFTPQGGKVEIVSEPITDDDGRRGCRIFVRDTGCGMSEEFIKHMYEPFSQENNDDQYVQQGTGLGLPIVKSIIETMGGTINVESTIGKGTQFTIVLYPERIEDVINETDAGFEKDAVIEGTKILIAEDNELNTLIARKMLEKKGCIVTSVVNGKQAVEAFANAERGQYDIILMDVRMPIMDGITATRNIRRLEREDARLIPIVAMTADAFSEDISRTNGAGMNAHLTKPIEGHILYKTIASFVKNKF